jgi:hypothetical protein
MREIDLETAVGEIKQACYESRSSGEERWPFFFLVGAGLSHPPIPLASEIQRRCQEIAKEYRRTDEPKGKEPIDVYSHWFSSAFPHRIRRQTYLRKLIEGKTISHANFRLAHLLLDKTIANLVVTSNFDDFLSQALLLFGKKHIVCDHPRTVERIDPEREDVQIIHVHGTYWFYDCCNLHGEIEERAVSSGETTLTMASLLDHILSRRSPLVIGYSGWEGDVIMKALKRRLQSGLPYNAYWFCYRRSAVDSLPVWLKSKEDVVFVTPPLAEASRKEGARQAEEDSGRETQERIASQAEARGVSEKKGDEPTLTAEKVLDRLIQQLKPTAPMLTEDPLGFFAEQLRDSLLQDEGAKPGGDIYSIGSVIDRIEQARKREARESAESPLESTAATSRAFFLACGRGRESSSPHPPGKRKRPRRDASAFDLPFDPAQRRRGRPQL